MGAARPASLVAVAAALLAWPAPAAAAGPAGPALSIVISVPGGQATRLPVAASVRLQARERFTGSLSIRLLQQDPLGQGASVLEWEEPVDVPARGEWSGWILLPARAWDRLELSAGGTRVVLQPPGEAQASPEGPVALVLSGSGQGWEALTRWRPHSVPEGTASAGGLRVVYVTSPDLVPPLISAYRDVQMVVLAPDFPAQRLSAAQRRALAGYLREGGTAVLPRPSPAAWAPLTETLQAAASQASGPGPPGSRAGLLSLPAEPGELEAALATWAPGAGLEPAPAQADDAGASVPPPSDDALRARLFDALAATPAPSPPRWSALASLAYAAAVGAWAGSLPRGRRAQWLAAGVGLVAAASVAAVVGAWAFRSRLDRPRALLLVRPAGLTGSGWYGPASDPGPLRAELLVAFPGLADSPWELRSAGSAGPVVPAPLSPAELPRGSGGVRVRRAGGTASEPVWQVEPLRSPGSGPQGGRALFYVDAPLPDLLAAAGSGRGALISPAGVVPLQPGRLSLAGRLAAAGEAELSALASVEAAGLWPGPDVLRGMLAEALLPAATGSLQGLARAAAASLADAISPPAPPDGQPAPLRYAAVLVPEMPRPLVEARRPGGRWSPVATGALVVLALAPESPGLPHEGASPP